MRAPAPVLMETAAGQGMAAPLSCSFPGNRPRTESSSKMSGHRHLYSPLLLLSEHAQLPSWLCVMANGGNYFGRGTASVCLNGHPTAGLYLFARMAESGPSAC